MYLYKSGLLPNSFNDIFFLNCDVHSCNTRSKNFFRLPYCRTKVGKFSLRFQGPKIFNSPCSQIQNATSTALFNSKLKSLFLVKAHFSSPNACGQFFASFAFFLFILALFFVTFSFSFLHLHVQHYLLLS